MRGWYCLTIGVEVSKGKAGGGRPVTEPTFCATGSYSAQNLCRQRELWHLSASQLRRDAQEGGKEEQNEGVKYGRKEEKRKIEFREEID